MGYTSNILIDVADILKRHLSFTSKIPAILSPGKPVAKATA